MYYHNIFFSLFLVLKYIFVPILVIAFVVYSIKFVRRINNALDLIEKNFTDKTD